MNPFGGLDYFLLLLLVLLPVVICGLKGKQLRVCGMLVCAVMLLAIFRTPRALLLLAAFWLWQTALTFGYLHVPEVYLWDGGQLEQLTDFNGAALEGVTISVPERLTFTNRPLG